MNLLDHFILNSAAYNRAATAEFIENTIERNRWATGPLEFVIHNVDKSYSIKEVVSWCAKNPQPIEELEKAAELMINGWHRAQIMMMIEERAASANK